MNREEVKSLLKVVENPANIGFITELQMRGLAKVNPYTNTLTYDNYLRILEEDKLQELEGDAKREKDILDKNAEVLRDILKNEKLDDKAIRFLQTYVKSVIIRCLDVGYQGVAVDYISLLADPRIINENCPMPNQSRLVKKCLIQTLQSYARRAIEDGYKYHDKAISILLDAKRGVFGYDMRSVPVRELADAYNNATISFNGFTAKNPDKLTKDCIKEAFKRSGLRCNPNALRESEEKVRTHNKEFGDD